MKQYVIDELRAADYKALKTYLAEHYGPAAMDGIYWIPVENGLLTDIQKAHRECQPHYQRSWLIALIDHIFNQLKLMT